jgi:hypothetical protein
MKSNVLSGRTIEEQALQAKEYDGSDSGDGLFRDCPISCQRVENLLTLSSGSLLGAQSGVPWRFEPILKSQPVRRRLFQQAVAF